jgi:beta-N-acetylhexosaminidase
MRFLFKRTNFVFFILVSFISLAKAQPEFSNPSTSTISGQEELRIRQQIESSLVLLENKDNLLPLDRLDTLRIASVSIGKTAFTSFQNFLSKYTKVDHFNLDNFKDRDKVAGISRKLIDYNLIIAGFDEISKTDTLINDLIRDKKSVFVLFGNAKDADELNFAKKPEAFVFAPQTGKLAQELAVQLIFGGIAAKGQLDESLGKSYKSGNGIKIEKPIRLKYTIPEEVGLNSLVLKSSIDSIVNNALEKQAFPGCNVLVAKEGKVIFKEVYGYHTYEKIIPVKEDDLYDLASVTKISGGLPGIMKLYDMGKINPDEKVSFYFPEWENRLFHRSNKDDITVRELLAHQSGLVPSILFWKRTMDDGKLSPKWYAFEKDNDHSLFVAPGIWLENKFINYINKEIRKSPLKTRGKYVYSDLPFLIAPQIVSNISGKPFQQFLNENFYCPLGATTLTYLPLNKFSRDRIVPTENDDFYRKQQLQGSVHDESAATMGGLSGNAGLFTSANDLAKLMQMYLQMGSYGGKQYLSEATMKEFTRVQFPQNNNRRGMGFDKPVLNNQDVKLEEAYPTKEASPESFGHFGYTGTFVWIDPKYNLVFIFLSNRVYPTRNNNLISDLNVRTDILSVIYKTLNR